MADAKNKNVVAVDQQGSSVRQFIENLRNAPSSDTIITGMVKPSENNDGLLVAHPGDCSYWAHIPEAAVQAVKNTGRVQCAGHSHVLAEIHLKTPTSDLEKAYSQLANLHHARVANLAARASMQSSARSTCPDGSPPILNQYGVPTCL